MESIRIIEGVEYINDSKSTNLDSTISALSSYEKNIILILGGLDKGSTDFSKIQVLFQSSIKMIITYGKSGRKISNQLDKINDLKYLENFDECIIYAVENSISGDTVLLSPGCASYDQFRNYKERGGRYRELINRLKE